MDRAVHKYFAQSLAPSTKATYSSAIKRFICFCSTFNLTPLPLTDTLLSRYAAFLAENNLSFPSIRLYLSALRFLQVSHGHSNPSLSSTPYLQLVLRGIHRSGPGQSRQKRLPITPHILHQLYSLWSAAPVTYDKVMLWAACCLGFFGFMRSGEFTCPSLAAYEHSMLSPTDITVDSRDHPTFLSVSLKRSKTDPFGAGSTIIIGRTNHAICPVTAILSYLSIRESSDGPLFIFQNGTTLSKTRLVTALKNALYTVGIDATGYSGHSFRIGAATAAASAGLNDSLIQSLGRWKSAAFLEYIRTPHNTFVEVSSLLLEPCSPSTTSNTD